MRVGADVAGDLADLLVWDEDTVLAAEAEKQVVAGDSCDLLRLEPEQLGDPVVLVDDVVARAEIGEARERPAGRRSRPRRPPAEDLGVREKRDPELAPHEAPPRGRDGEREALGRLPRLEHLGLDPTEEGAAALGLAAMRERDDDVEPLAHEPAELVLGLREAARHERRALGVEREPLALRERIELGCALERELGDALVGPDGPHLVGLPDEIGHPVEGRHEIVRDLGRRLLVVGEPDVVVGAEPLGGRVDRRLGDLAERTLGERREGADALDLVAEELDPERLAAGRGEHVDEPASHGDLAAFLDSVHPLVPGGDEALGEPLDPRRPAAGDEDRAAAARPREARARRPRARRRRRARRVRARRAPGHARRRGAAAARGPTRGSLPATEAARRGPRRGTSLTASAASRASVSSGSRTQSPRPSSSWSAASRSGSAGSATRARVGSASANAGRRSSARRRSTRVWSTGRSMTNARNRRSGGGHGSRALRRAAAAARGRVPCR